MQKIDVLTTYFNELSLKLKKLFQHYCFRSLLFRYQYERTMQFSA